MTTWTCYAHTLPGPLRVDCRAHGTGERGAERHTRETGHPTATGRDETSEETSG